MRLNKFLDVVADESPKDLETFKALMKMINDHRVSCPFIQIHEALHINQIPHGRHRHVFQSPLGSIVVA